MRIGELSRQTGVSVPTIKYYLRERLLPPGESTGPNQARYDDRHARRLRLVRALVDIGGLSIATVQELLAQIDQPDPDLHDLLGRALQSSSGGREPTEDAELATAERETDELIRRHGWQVWSGAPARRVVAEVLVALRRLGQDNMITYVDDYADAVERIAEVDLKMTRQQSGVAARVQTAVVGTILGDQLIAGLRRLAQEDASARIFGRPAAPGDADPSPR